MHKNKIEARCADLLKLSEALKLREKQIEAFQAYKYDVFEKSNSTINAVFDFLKSPVQNTLPPPIPAFASKTPDNKIALKMFNIAKDIMMDSTPLLYASASFDEMYTAYCNCLVEFIKTSTVSTQKLLDTPYNKKTFVKVLVHQEERYAYFNAELDKLFILIGRDEPLIKEIKNKLNLLKGVN